jgi:ABC-type glutathione transport system ATPase component
MTVTTQERSASAPARAAKSEDARPLLRLEGIRKVFTTDEVETHALSDVHLEIARGEFMSISGPSGCGKSTLLAILGLLDAPSGGAYWRSARASGTARSGSSSRASTSSAISRCGRTSSCRSRTAA